MNKYRYTGHIEVMVPLLGRKVSPGDVVETPHALIHPHFERVRPAKKDSPEPEGDAQ